MILVDMMEMKIQGYQVIEKRVTKQGNGARVLVPVAWMGRRVKVILLDDADIPATDPDAGESA